jgi:DNA-binding NarL/FixJ family response regulator
VREDPMLPEDTLRALFASVVRLRGTVAGEQVSPRELEVLFECVARGLDTQEIAGVLVIAVRTVQEHLDKASRRLRYDSPAIMQRELFRAFARAEAKAEVAPFT